MARCPVCGETTAEAICPKDGVPTVDDPLRADPLVGTTLAERYTLLERLGAGGMSVVYRARQTAMDRDVAVKLLGEKPTLVAVQRFHREMRASAGLSHPNCVQVHDFGQADGGQLYLVMELVRGETLGALLRREGRLDPRRAARIGAQIARGAGAAHALGLVHRDLKPDNVMLTAVVGEPELAKVLDFGIVQAVGEERGQALTRSGTFMGTPRYAAPEQARGEDVGLACDLYSLGLVLFEMVAGRLPRRIEAAAGPERLRAAAGPDVPPALDALVASLIERDPAQRPASADDVAQRLAAIAASTPAPGAGRSRRRVWLLTSLAATGVAVAGLGARAYRGRAVVPVAPPVESSAEPSAAPSAEPEPAPEDPGASTDVFCGGSACPALDGYAPACNAQKRCEYTRTPRTAPWQEHDAWIYVRATAFAMGSSPRDPDQWPKSETPQHSVALQRGFFIGRYEVTTALYEACEAAGACAPPGAPEAVALAGGRSKLGDLGVPLNRSAHGRDRHPQNGLTWEQARAACAWLGGRLPSEAEWELVAHGPQGYLHPWGGPAPSPKEKRTGNFADSAAAARWKAVEPIPGYQDGYADTAPVGSFPDGAGMAYGALDLGGNVAEWVEDCEHFSYDGAPDDGSAWTYDCHDLRGSEPNRVVRGGSFLDRDARAVARDQARALARSPALGARCARTAPSTAPDDARWKQKVVEVAAELRCLDRYVTDPARRPSERTRLLFDNGLARIDPTSNVFSQGSIVMPIRAVIDPDVVVRVFTGADPKLGAAIDRAAAECMPSVPPGSDAERARMLEAFTVIQCARRRRQETGALRTRAIQAVGLSPTQVNHAIDRLERDTAFNKELDRRVDACAAGDGGPATRP